jgi:hypothetical protein
VNRPSALCRGDHVPTTKTPLALLPDASINL